MMRLMSCFIGLGLLLFVSITSAQENIVQPFHNLELISEIGRGEIVDMQFSLDSQSLAITTSRGVWFYSATESLEYIWINQSYLFAPEDMTTKQPQLIAVAPDFTKVGGLNYDGEITIWDVATREKLLTIENFSPDRLAFDETGDYIAAANMQTWRISSVSDGTIIAEGDVFPHEVAYIAITPEIITELAFIDANSLLVRASTIALYSVHYSIWYDIGSGRITRQEEFAYGGDYNPDFNYTVMNDYADRSDLKTRILRFASRDSVGMLELRSIISDPYQYMYIAGFPYEGYVRDYAISPDNSLIAIIDSSNQRLSVWDIERARSFPPCPLIRADYIVPENRECDEELTALRLETSIHASQWLEDKYETTYGHTRQYTSIDDEWNVEISDVIQLTNRNGTVIERTIPEFQLVNYDFVTITDSLLIITETGPSFYGSSNGAVIIWDISEDAESEEPIEIFTEFGNQVLSTVVNRDQTLMAVSSTDGYIRIWDLNTMTQLIEERYPILFEQLSFTADNQILTALGRDGIIYIWQFVP